MKFKWKRGLLINEENSTLGETANNSRAQNKCQQRSSRVMILYYFLKKSSKKNKENGNSSYQPNLILWPSLNLIETAERKGCQSKVQFSFPQFFSSYATRPLRNTQTFSTIAIYFKTSAQAKATRAIKSKGTLPLIYQ